MNAQIVQMVTSNAAAKWTWKIKLQLKDLPIPTDLQPDEQSIAINLITLGIKVGILQPILRKQEDVSKAKALLLPFKSPGGVYIMTFRQIVQFAVANVAKVRSGFASKRNALRALGIDVDSMNEAQVLQQFTQLQELIPSLKETPNE
jgi:hypothetical protein